jgi:SNW domain-containing protein 1
LPIQTDAEGRVRYDAIVKQGMGKYKSLVQTQFTDLMPKDVKEGSSLSRPSEEEVHEVAEKTRLALEKITSGIVCIVLASSTRA